MDNRTEEALCSCVNVDDVTLTIKDQEHRVVEEHRVSGTVRFMATQRILRRRTFEGPQKMRGLKDARGSIDPKGEESINIMVKVTALTIGKYISIQGLFKDERTGKTANITLSDAAFDPFKWGLPTEFKAGVEHCP
ncbi:MAG: hypothetical protein WAL97_07425 [Halobacteriota archaeon]|jgi:hypothetical protein